MTLTGARAIATIEGRIAELKERALELGGALFTSTEEQESEAWWQTRRAFIQLAEAQGIRDTLAAADGEATGPVEHVAETRTPKKRRRKP